MVASQPITGSIIFNSIVIEGIQVKVAYQLNMTYGCNNLPRMVYCLLRTYFLHNLYLIQLS